MVYYIPVDVDALRVAVTEGHVAAAAALMQEFATKISKNSIEIFEKFEFFIKFFEFSNFSKYSTRRMEICPVLFRIGPARPPPRAR